jgi:hypothetical protein
MMREPSLRNGAFGRLADALEFDDFELYARECLKIRTKIGAIEPLVLNQAQRFIHARFEEQRARTGRVRALVLKGRQQGASTYVEGRFFWRVSRRRGVRAFILTNADDSSTAIFAMARRFYDNCPEEARPYRSASNAKELIFSQLDSGYRIATAGSEAAGRSETLQYFHGSEVAYWPNAQAHVSGALQAVPDEPDTEIVLESTSRGRAGLFWKMCERALRGEGEYILVFVPWYWERGYRKTIEPGFAPSSEEAEYQLLHSLDDEQIAWRRSKIEELHGVHAFRREYPATPEEAFSAEVKGALWTRGLIDRLRAQILPPLKRIVVAVDPSGGDGARNDEVGIIVAGVSFDGCGFVLEDASARLSPSAWGEKAAALYERWKADRIIAEANFGGAMVENTIRAVSPNVPVKLVSASRGKAVRAEPIAALYERGKVNHVGRFIALEDEMSTWKPGDKRSPNRMDALVWAFTELMLGEQTGERGWLDYATEQMALRSIADAAAAILNPKTLTTRISL